MFHLVQYLEGTCVHQSTVSINTNVQQSGVPVSKGVQQNRSHIVLHAQDYVKLKKQKIVLVKKPFCSVGVVAYAFKLIPLLEDRNSNLLSRRQHFM